MQKGTKRHQQGEQQARQSASCPTPALPSISTTNTLPLSASDMIVASSAAASSVDIGSLSVLSPSDSSTHVVPGFASFRSLNIPGTRDAAVRLYSDWQESNYTDEGYKMDVRTIRDAILGDASDLERVCTYDPQYFVQLKKVRLGIAWRFVHDIPDWVKREQSRSTELE